MIKINKPGEETTSPGKYFVLLLTHYLIYDILILVDTEEYPSSAEGIGLENRQAG
jgi:hypothetical protein